ncbi:DNA-binding response regulator, OmpR family, contains REC and winged-helix (wHTH) domain [Caldanaerobius fijiensis DSM 17918]|uniref:Stage 0 sporulation protein A homolog n=2 Tax=Caldanaerobius TaxID=862261 RepID=A0A1M4V5J4_9THEO|nr:DNA-binding response regulator, OmpR family, contains REC and winged-helix (wHTH) domain [Caldanaerobius fijiensis DSM 17918]
MKMDKVLVIEDEKGLQDILKTYLEKNGYSAFIAGDGRSGLELIEKYDISLVILDVMLPDMDGWRVLRELRETSDVPVIMLTARGEEYDKLLGFELGADDYVVKPFSPRELMARIKALLKRVDKGGAKNVLEWKGIVVDVDSREVYVDGNKVDFTPKEFDLLKYLMENRGRAITREQCLERVWGYDFYGDLRTVDTHIKQIREKLGDKRYLVKTVWGIGYKLDGE